MSESQQPFSRRYRTEILVVLLLMAATVTAFGRVCGCDFTSLDDEEYVTKNPLVLGGLAPANLAWAFTTTYAANWHPLTWLSLQLDQEVYGLAPWGYHLTNLLLHTANVVLLFLALRRLTGAVWRSAVVAAFFGVHPLHVESVAWVAERKDVLSSFFWMLTLWTYAWYVEHPRLPRYLLLMLVFALGLIAKPMLVTLPFVLLLLDYWPLQRLTPGQRSLAGPPGRADAGRPAPTSLGWVVGEKIPLLMLTAASVGVTLFAQQEALVQGEKLPFHLRALNALAAYADYVIRMVWPQNLAVFYPHPGAAVSDLRVAGACLLLGTVTAFVLWAGPRRPYLAVGWFWYLGTLVPVIGLVQVGGQATADRYTYIPLIGLFLLLSWGSFDVCAARPVGKFAWAGSVTVLLLICMALTWKQVGYWSDSISLWTHTIAATGNNYKAHDNLGLIYLEQGKLDEARQQLEAALKIEPDDLDALNNLGVIAFQLGKDEEAARYFVTFLRKQPDDADTHHNLGIVFLKHGKLKEAREHLETALRLKPDFASAHRYLGQVFRGLGKPDEARKHFQAAAHLNRH
jgi:tetratricopeptide (TPR) repeat protein